MKDLIIFLLPLLSLWATKISAEELKIQNNCGHGIYVKCEGVNSGSFSLDPGQSNTVSINRGASSRVWAHAGCDGGGNNCDTKETEVSLAEMHWSDDGMTWYDVSMVDAYNLPLKMEPYNPAAGGNCREGSCTFKIDADCPGNYKIDKGGRAVSCQSPNRDAVTDYSEAIKRSCPGVYSWSQDNEAGMRACNPGNDGLNVIFC